MEHPSLVEGWLKAHKQKSEDAAKVYFSEDAVTLLVQHGPERVFVESEGVLDTLP